MSESLTNDGTKTIWAFDGTAYEIDTPSRDEVVAYHKVRQYHAIQNVLSELSHRREIGKATKLPTMDEVEAAASTLQDLEDDDGEWHLLLEEAVDLMMRGEFE